ncbi:30S ribosomal protein S21 [bacterium]|nr:30S ribosomal protein S21 [bacterium]
MKKHFNKDDKKKDVALKVYVHGNTDRDLTDALRRLSRRVDRSNLMDELRRRRHYQKPSLVKKEKRV